MSSAGYGRRGAFAYGTRGGGNGIHPPSHLESTMSSASMMLEDIDGHGRRVPQEAAILFESYGGKYSRISHHLEQNHMSRALSTTSKLPYEYARRDRRGAVFAIGGNNGEYPAYPSLYDRADIEKLMDEYPGRTHRRPSPSYSQRYIDSVQAALRLHAGGLGDPLLHQPVPQTLRGGPAMSDPVDGHYRGFQVMLGVMRDLMEISRGSDPYLRARHSQGHAQEPLTRRRSEMQHSPSLRICCIIFLLPLP